MASRSDITPELCRQLLRYEPETGRLFWLPRPREMFSSAQGFGGWNAKFPGKEAFTASNDDGYRVGNLLGLLFRAHRVAWAIAYGDWPALQIDHRNGDKSNNRLSNLREVTNQENQRNVRLTKNNSSGVCGVNWRKALGKWHARIGIDGKIRHLGVFDNLADATAARRSAEQELGFSVTHGT